MGLGNLTPCRVSTHRGATGCIEGHGRNMMLDGYMVGGDLTYVLSTESGRATGF